MKVLVVPEPAVRDPDAVEMAQPSAASISPVRVLAAPSEGLEEAADAVSVDAQADDGSTALIKATLWNHAEIVALLLQYGAQAAIRDADGWTAWQIAVEKGNFEIIELLRAAGA